MIRLYIFDADGTLRETNVMGQPCPHAPGEWRLRRGVRERLARLDPAALIGVASNQDHIAYALVDESTARALLVEAARAATGRDLPPEAIRLCPHCPEDGCECRKPAPGMLLAIMRHYGVPPERTLFVGDAESDREAAARAGCAFRFAAAFFVTATSPD